MILVSVAETKARLRYDTDDDDADLTLAIEGASEAVVTYLGASADTFLNSSGEPDVNSAGDPVGVPKAVVNATIVLVGYMKKNVDADPDKGFQDGSLPAPCKALLYPLKDQVFS
jgi:gp6-like head-tail connector protein